MQHLLIARARAIEEALPVARAANTGISAMIDPYGPDYRASWVWADGCDRRRLPRALPPTIYARFGDWSFRAAFVAPSVALGLLARRASGPSAGNYFFQFRDMRLSFAAADLYVAVPKKQANPIDAQVGNRVRIRRMLIGMSQEKLGDLLGLTFQQVQKYEKGVNRIGAGRLFEIARILGVPIDFFYDGVGTAWPMALAEVQRRR